MAQRVLFNVPDDFGIGDVPTGSASTPSAKWQLPPSSLDDGSPHTWVIEHLTEPEVEVMRGLYDSVAGSIGRSDANVLWSTAGVGVRETFSPGTKRVARVSGTAAERDVPASGDAATSEVVLGDDSRLTDARTPTAHTHGLADITDSGALAALSEITNSEVAAGAAIALSKLATDPLARANHTGTQTLATISDSGTAAAQDVGTAIGDIPQLEDVGGGTPGLPAVDGSQLLNLPSSSDVYDFVRDSTDYSATSFQITDTESGKHRLFLNTTGTQDAEIQTGISDDYVSAFEPGAGVTLTLSWVTGVTVDGVAGPASANVQAAGTIRRVDTDTFETEGGIEQGSQDVWKDTDFHDKVLSAAELKDYSESRDAQSGVTGGITLDYAAAPYHEITHGAGNITSVALSNLPASGKMATLTVDYIQDGTGGRTVTHPTGTSWFGGTPTFDTAAGKRNRVVYTTDDAGSTVLAHYAGAL